MTSGELKNLVDEYDIRLKETFADTEIGATWAGNLALAEIAFQLALMNEERRLNTKEGNG